MSRPLSMSWPVCLVKWLPLLYHRYPKQVGSVDECVLVSCSYLCFQEQRANWKPQTILTFSSRLQQWEARTGQHMTIRVYWIMFRQCAKWHHFISFTSFDLNWSTPLHRYPQVGFKKVNAKQLCGVLDWNLNVKGQHVDKIPGTFWPTILKTAAIHLKFFEMFINYGQSNSTRESNWSKLKPNPPVLHFDL